MNISMIGQKGMPAHFGGVERHVHELSVRLAADGFAVSVYARDWYTDPSVTLYEGVEIRHIKTIKSKHLDTAIHTMLSTLDAIKRGADVIHYHGVGPALFSWIPRLLSKKTRVLTTFHSIDRKHDKWNGFARLVLRFGEWAACTFAHETIAVSQTIQQYARDAYDKEIVYIPNAVPEVKPTKETTLLKKWDLKKGNYMIMVSRLIPHKGAHDLIDAFILLKETGRLKKGMKLVIVGDGHHTDDYVASLKKQAKKHEDILFTGFQTGEVLNQLFSNAAFMVHPSYNEGLPICVLEGMSYKLPVLVSDILEHRDLVYNHEYLYEVGNVTALADSMEVLQKKKKSELNKQGKHNKQITDTEYHWDTVVQKIARLYRMKKNTVLEPVSGLRVQQLTK